MHLFTGDLYLVKQMKVSLKMRRYKQSWKESRIKRVKKNPYLTAGDKTYIIGTQDGNFPDLGGHTPGDGRSLESFDQAIRWLLGKMTDNKGNSCWLENAIQYTNYPFGSKFEYAPLFNNSIRVNRFQFAHKEKWCCYYLYHRNVSDSEQTVLLILSQNRFVACMVIRDNRVKDANDVVNWDAQDAILKRKI